MLREEDDGSPAKCRERRRRRIEMRRFAALSAAGPPPPQYSFHSVGLGESSAESSALVDDQRKRFRTAEGRCLPSSSSTSSGDDVEARPTPPPPASALPPPPPPQVVAGTTVDGAEPAYGVMSVTGRSREMEDAVSVRTGLCFPEIDRRKPVHVFAVFDGHGGHHVARLCSEKMHVFVEEELMRVSSTEAGGDESVWREAMKRSFQRMDDVAMNTCACGGDGSRCGCHPLEVALGGSTAVVAALTCDRIIVANCGDSRAVLCRGGRAIPLSRDHKPDRPDELARIQAAGGRVIELNGARVEGILAMSRAIGDRYLKRVVISEPEITFTTREAGDDCLILASDGLWDVLSVEMACEVACACLREGSPPPPPIIDINSGPPTEDEENRQIYPSRSMLAAALLTRLALGRRSLDNISVIVVDLKRS